MLRAGVLAGPVAVEDFAVDAKLLAQLASRPAPASLAVVLDLATVATVPGRLVELCAAIKKASPSAKIGLVASAALHVDESLTAWAEQLGASVVVPQLSAARWASTGGRLLSAMVGDGNCRAPGIAQFTRDSAAADFWDRDTQTQLIAAAEFAHFDLAALAHSMGAGGEGGLAIADHSYHLSVYPECFVASEAVTWLAKKLDIPRELAVAKGQALQAAGLIYHVAREQVFGDEKLFYRISRLPARWDMASFYVLIRQPSGFRVADRPYLGEVYSNCFVGSEAVAWMTDHGLTANEAMTVGQRLMDASLIHHVVDEHAFKDKELYYRFYRTAAAPKAKQ